jgi:heme-degrading monooxygenase HmoA
MSLSDTYKVILIFNLKKGQADEELKRSKETDSFPNMLAGQPGFVSLELVRVDESKTMSVQTWKTEQDWWRGLEAVKPAQAKMPVNTTPMTVPLKKWRMKSRPIFLALLITSRARCLLMLLLLMSLMIGVSAL